MLDVATARQIVLATAKPLAAEVTALMTPAIGQVLAQDIHADLDSPPFDKSMMDGYAIRTGDLVNGFGELRVIGEVIAGDVAALTVHTGEAMRVYTGAPVPAGADAVVMQERTKLSGEIVSVKDEDQKFGKNIIRRATEMKAGDLVVSTGTVLTPTAFGLLATVGKTSVMAVPRPRAAVVATGNEIVEPNRTPTGSQIRNSNGPMLTAQIASAGGLPRYLGIATDDEESLRSYIREGLESADVLILAGGVSAGKLDLVPKVLADLGATAHFHKLRMKPGKPLLFASKGEKLIFGLPGNPVSAFVGFELFVRPALRNLCGLPVPDANPRRLPLTKHLMANHDRPTYHPAVVEEGRVNPLPWFGSADLRAILTANAFIVLPEGSVNYSNDSLVDVISLGD